MWWVFFFVFLLCLTPSKSGAAALYPKPLAGKHPWWVKPIAFKHTKDIVGLASSLLLVASIGYGIWKVNGKNFDVHPIDIKTSANITNGDTPTVNAVKSQEDVKSLTRTGKWKVAILLFWMVLPPIWFWFEYVGLYRYDNEDQREKLDEFKYTQDVASKIWIALVTALTILYFGKDIRT